MKKYQKTVIEGYRDEISLKSSAAFLAPDERKVILYNGLNSKIDEFNEYAKTLKNVCFKDLAEEDFWYIIKFIKYDHFKFLPTEEQIKDLEKLEQNEKIRKGTVESVLSCSLSKLDAYLINYDGENKEIFINIYGDEEASEFANRVVENHAKYLVQQDHLKDFPLHLLNGKNLNSFIKKCLDLGYYVLEDSYNFNVNKIDLNLLDTESEYFCHFVSYLVDIKRCPKLTTENLKNIDLSKLSKLSNGEILNNIVYYGCEVLSLEQIKSFDWKKLDIKTLQKLIDMFKNRKKLNEENADYKVIFEKLNLTELINGNDEQLEIFKIIDQKFGVPDEIIKNIDLGELFKNKKLKAFGYIAPKNQEWLVSYFKELLLAGYNEKFKCFLDSLMYEDIIELTQSISLSDLNDKQLVIFVEKLGQYFSKKQI